METDNKREECMVNTGDELTPVMELAYFHRWADDWTVSRNNTTGAIYEERDTYGIAELRVGARRGEVVRMSPAYIKFIYNG
jgi:hypothetical protein